jgi:hypothetical protein
MTSVLDEFFGPIEAHDPQEPAPKLTQDEKLLKALQGGTHWRCEERIRTTLDAFVECWPLHMPRSSEVRREHYAGARALVNEVGEMEAPAFLRWAATVVESECRHLPIKTARSLMFLIPRWRAREQGPEWFKKPCPKCCTFHPPGPKCPEEMEEEDD